MADNLTHFLATADKLAAEVIAIRAAVELLAKYAANDVADAPPTVAAFAHDITPATIEASADKRTGKADAAILAALTGSWKSAKAIHASVGNIVSRAAIYQRMPILAARHPDQIEQHATDKAWRKKGGDKAPEDADNALPTLPAIVTGKVTKVAATVAANDATIAPPEDVRDLLLIKGDGLKTMRGLADKSVDLVMADLPYGMTDLAIDPKIDVEEWMAEMGRIVTDKGSIVAFSAQPFATDLMNASRQFDQGAQRFFRQEIIWEKPQASGFQQCAGRHLKAHENILIFSRGTIIGKRSPRGMTYNPQGVTERMKVARTARRTINYLSKQLTEQVPGTKYPGYDNCPRSVVYYSKDHASKSLHSFAKPVALLEYLTLTYSNSGELVIDPTMGSGSAGVAAINTGRRFIGVENGTDMQGRDIYQIAKARIGETLAGRVA